jgi:hypothetical protein
MILHLDDKNLPLARTYSFCFVSERYFENHYNSLQGSRRVPLRGPAVGFKLGLAPSNSSQISSTFV